MKSESQNFCSSSHSREPKLPMMKLKKKESPSIPHTLHFRPFQLLTRQHQKSCALPPTPCSSGSKGLPAQQRLNAANVSIFPVSLNQYLFPLQLHLTSSTRPRQTRRLLHFLVPFLLAFCRPSAPLRFRRCATPHHCVNIAGIPQSSTHPHLERKSHIAGKCKYGT
ncbi:hypothetical protein K437DRAFT_112874 [Tilletiaria anomala UBC 951]|uniref:Uncharacterized protein n=1 Tax=Tilletiaria anomala (strain ATCC 24038 / CBS 436.72 / UBC 951) TaxID=1037660 RepID=A0A066W4H3_TILAU|nr:uncharacterized protein K437DRAFT_112874 [Tilletiaria anomala UBC 951]KDN45974.1 hypothetical protein K437DRAFT_112874 [Tilletiaria anomala UBC 951]